MKITLGFDSKSEFLPAYHFTVFKTDFDNHNLLKQLVLEKEEEILRKHKPFPEHDGYDWITNRLYEYNLLDYASEYPVLEEFKKFIKDSYLGFCKNPQKIYANCWANIVRNNGRTITPHDHADAHINAPIEYSYVSGNICVQAENTNTYYANPYIPKQAIPIKNYPGELILFPSWVRHWTDENKSDEPRISIAFDIVTEEVYNMPNVLRGNFREL